MRQSVRGAANFLLVALGILSAAFGLKGFLLSSRFIDGGVTGVSMLLSDVTGLPLALLIPAINLPFVALGYRQVGPAFALKSAAAIAGLSLCLALAHFPEVTPDKLLTAVVVVSARGEEIRQSVIRDLGRGVTVYKGRRGWTDAEQDVLFCVVTRLEIGRVKSLVAEHDPAAFVVVHPLSDVSGGVVKKGALH